MEWIVARWVTFVATVLLAGACAVGLALIPRVGADDAARRLIARDVGRLGIGAALALIPASFLRLADQLLALQSPGDPITTGLEPLLFSTTWGTGFVWQMAALSVAGIGIWLAWRTHGAVWCWMLAGVGATGLCGTLSLMGHAIGSENQTALAVAADVAHVLGAGAWLGGVAVLGWLGVAVPNADGMVSPTESALADARLRQLVPLVPPVALTGAALLVASGVVSTVLHVEALSDLWLTEWGRYVTAKSVLALVIVVLGALNWRRLGPAMPGAGVSALRKSLIAEVLVALLVLMITAVLVVTPLPGE